ncbi:MAG: hypothetical protein NTX22_13335 [Ignavibacteriales bacterium]|nr:hypothetical protein [Ignavibacteriales bacterium]
MSQIFICLSVCCIFLSCGRNQQSEFEYINSRDTDKFFIEVKSFEEKTKANDFAIQLQGKIKNRVCFYIDSTNRSKFYKVCIGTFGNSYSAGEVGYRLFIKKYIQDYSVIQNFHPVYDEFSNLIYVGMFQGKSSLYKFNLKSKSSEIFWRLSGENVIEFVSSSDTNIAFLLTAIKSGRKGIFPFINGVKLYKVNTSEEKVELVKDVGDVIQLFTVWENDNSFKMIFNSFDKKVSTFVNQQTTIFGTNGRILSDIKQTFDLVKENYPQLPKRMIKRNAPDNTYSLVDSTFNGVYNYYLKTSTQKYFIFSTDQKLNQIVWVDGKQLIFSTVDISPSNKTIHTNSPKTSTLTIFDVKDKKLVKQWVNSGEKNFLIKSNFLFFDDDFGRKSKIYIYDLDNKQIVETISVTGGCGLKKIPVIPQFY